MNIEYLAYFLIGFAARGFVETALRYARKRSNAKRRAKFFADMDRGYDDRPDGFLQ